MPAAAFVWSLPFALPTWVPLSGANASVGIAFGIIEAHKPSLLIKVAVPQEGPPVGLLFIPQMIYEHGTSM
jgi:hypothetical protein